MRRVTKKRDADLDIYDWFRKYKFIFNDEALLRKIFINYNLYINVFLKCINVFSEHIKATMKADDDDEA